MAVRDHRRCRPASSARPVLTSRLLQRVLLGLLTDLAAEAAVRDAEQTYLVRRRALVDALDRAGVTVDTNGSGLNLWIPVDDERTPSGRLRPAASVPPGGLFQVGDGGGDHIRLTISRGTDPDDLAEAVAQAARRGGGTAGR